MCLILCANNLDSGFPLVIAANRDEFLNRPAARADWWEDHPDLLAGRDLEQMGTWLGCTKSGRFACVTNVRDRIPLRGDAPSRGNLVTGFLTADVSIEEYLSFLSGNGDQYNGYNILFGSAGRVAYHSNRGGDAGLLERGVYGISNALLDTPWPKVLRGKLRFRELLEGSPGSLPTEELFELLGNREVAPDDELPDTGLPIELERMASSIFADGRDYGTRCSTLLAIDEAGVVHFEERDLRGGPPRRFRFEIDPSD